MIVLPELLAMEREYLIGHWPLWKFLLALLVPVAWTALALAFWRRSLVYGLVVVNAMVLTKCAWTFYFGDVSGGLTLLPALLAGLAVCNAAIGYLLHRIRSKPYGTVRQSVPGE